MPQYAIFVKNGDGGISYLTTSILPLRQIMPHYGIFVMIVGGCYKLSDLFYSAPSRVYAPIWYICQEWGWGYKSSDHFHSDPSRIYAPLWYFFIIGDVGFKLSDPFYSTPLRNYAPLWYSCHDWGCGL